MERKKIYFSYAIIEEIPIKEDENNPDILITKKVNTETGLTPHKFDIVIDPYEDLLPDPNGKLPELSSLVNGGFLYKLKNEIDPNEINSYLDYHFKKYSGKKQEFIVYTSYLTQDLTGGAKPFVEKWIEGKRKKYHLPPAPYLSDSTKPVLNQKQISILFKVFMDKHIITNKKLNNTDYGKIINVLTGYSAETLRQAFSAKIEDIALSKEDFEFIIEKLTEVIKVLEHYKKDKIE